MCFGIITIFLGGGGKPKRQTARDNKVRGESVSMSRRDAMVNAPRQRNIGTDKLPGALKHTTNQHAGAPLPGTSALEIARGWCRTGLRRFPSDDEIAEGLLGQCSSSGGTGTSLDSRVAP